MLLNKFPSGQALTIKKIHAAGETLFRLSELGIGEETKVAIVKFCKYGGIILSADGNLIALGKRFGFLIEAEKC